MKIPILSDQIPSELSLLCETSGFDANGDFLFILKSFMATLNLAATIRVWATITKKKNYLLLWATEEVVVAVIVGATLCLVNP